MTMTHQERQRIEEGFAEMSARAEVLNMSAQQNAASAKRWAWAALACSALVVVMHVARLVWRCW